jgi:hypothetical protein
MGLFDNLTEIERSKELHSQACFQDTEPSERGPAVNSQHITQTTNALSNFLFLHPRIA